MSRRDKRGREMSQSDRGDRDRCPRRGRMRGTAPVMWAVHFLRAAEGGGLYRRGCLMPGGRPKGLP